MRDVVIVGVVIFVLFHSLGRALYFSGEALAESDFPICFPEVISAVFYYVGKVLKSIGFLLYRLSAMFACIYILKELL